MFIKVIIENKNAYNLVFLARFMNLEKTVKSFEIKTTIRITSKGNYTSFVFDKRDNLVFEEDYKTEEEAKRGHNSIRKDVEKNPRKYDKYGTLRKT